MGKFKLKKKIWLLIIVSIGTYLIYFLLGSLSVFNVWGAGTTHTKANSDKVTVADNGGIAGGAITLAIWVNQQATPSLDTSHGWLSQGDGDTNDVHYGFRYIDESGTKSVRATRNVKGTIDCATTFTYTVPLNEWHHWAMTYVSPNLKLYQNGFEVATSELTGTCLDMGNHPAAVNHMTAGIYDNDTYGTAKLAHAVIYDRALTAAEIRRLAFQRPNDSDAGLRLYWPIDEHTGTTVRNHANSTATVTAYDGTLSGTTGGFMEDNQPYGYK